MPARLTRKTDTNTSDPDPYSYPPSSTTLATPASEYPGYNDSTDHLAANSFIGRDEAVPGGRNRATYPPSNDDYAYEKGLNPVTRGSIAAQMAAEGQIPKKEGLRMWRSDEHKGAFTKGGRGRCCGRVCCCAIILVIIIIVSIVAAFFLWVKPPEVSFNGIEAPATGSEVSVQTDGFALNFRLNIGVINPNFFGATFNKISATAYYPLKPSTSFGGGSLDDVKINKNSNTTIHFPFQVNYTTSYDSDLSVLKDIATKCGFLTTTSSGTSDLTVNYKIILKLKVLAVSISPSFSSSASFACPLSESDISGLLSSGGLSSLAGGLSGSSSRFLSKRTEEELNEWQKRQLHDEVMGKVMSRGWEALARGEGEMVSERGETRAEMKVQWGRR